MIGDDGEVDGQLMTVVIGAGGDDVHAVDALHLRPFPGGRADLIRREIDSNTRKCSEILGNSRKNSEILGNPRKYSETRGYA